LYTINEFSEGVPITDSNTVSVFLFLLSKYQNIPLYIPKRSKRPPSLWRAAKTSLYWLTFKDCIEDCSW